MNYSDLSAYTHEQLSEYTHEQISEGILEVNLITDRSLLDVVRWRELRDKGWSSMSDVERQEWLGEITTTPAATKGMYTHNDLNRVERAVNFISSRLRDAGYKVPVLVTKTDWVYTDQITDDDMVRYFKNVEILRSFLKTFAGTPAAPTTKYKFNYEKANDVEKILTNVNKAVVNLTKSWCYTGEFISGEV